MSGELKPYPEMRDSGVRWLGKVPAHWNVRRLRNIAEMRVSNVDKHTKEGERPVRLCNYVDVYKNDRILLRMDFMKATATMEEVERFRLRSRDVLITKDSEAWNDIGVPAFVQEVEDDVVSGYHLALLRSDTRHLDGEFLFRALQSRDIAYQFHVRANGVTRYGLSHNAIKSVRLPVPPLPEQSAIARFLDHADRRIQRCIRAKEKLIALLEEQQHAMVGCAVTGHIDVRTGQPYTAYKRADAGLTESVPAHWVVRKLRQCVRIAGGMTPSMEDQRFWEGSIPWVTPKDMKRKRIRRSEIAVTETALHETPLRLIEAPAVLMVVRGMILARKVPIAWTMSPVTINQDMKALIPHDGISAEFLAHWLDSAQDALAALTDEAGHGTKRLPTERWQNLKVATPPPDEQDAIAKFLGRSRDTIAAAKASVEREIQTLQELRTRLIADVVTGKLDVRKCAATLTDGQKAHPKEGADWLNQLPEGLDLPTCPAPTGPKSKGKLQSRARQPR